MTDTVPDDNNPPIDVLRTAMVRETLPPWGQWAALTGLESVTQDEIATVLERVLSHPLPEQLRACRDLVQFVHQRSPTLITLVEPVLVHIERSADKDSSGQIWNSLGVLLSDSLARYDKAEAAFRKALELDMQNANFLGNFALFMQDVHHSHDEAESLFRRAIESDPNHANVLGNFSWFLLGQGRQKEVT